MRAALLLWLLIQPTLLVLQKPEHSKEPEWWLVYVTGALVLITAFLAAYTARLWKATKTLSEDAKATADRQAGEVRESLRIGRETIEAMERNAERQLRAYVFVESAKIREPYSETGGGITVTIKNFGQTPAYKYTAAIDTDLVNVPAGSLLRPRLGPIEGQGSIAPGGSIALNVGLRAFTAEERKVLIEGTKAFYAFGQIRYTDAFGTSRFTEFRYRFGGEFGSGEGDLALAEQGNDAD